jgi:hypothetical protein
VGAHGVQDAGERGLVGVAVQAEVGRRDPASGETAVASTISIAAPESARWPRWMKCQSVADPSSALYWHIGAMMMRLASRSSPI